MKEALGRPNGRSDDNIKNGYSRNWMGPWIGLIWLRIGKCACYFECGNEPSGSIQFGEFLD